MKNWIFLVGLMTAFLSGCKDDIRRSNYPVLAIDTLTSLSKAGDDVAQEALASRYYFGEGGVDKGYQKAMYWYAESAKQGNISALNNLAAIYEYGDGVEANGELAESWYKQAAESGSIASQFALGAMYARGDQVKQNCDEAIKWLVKASDQEHPAAQSLLAVMYKKGKCVQLDESKARAYHLKAAMHGDVNSQFLLAGMYWDGAGGEKDHVQSYRWYFVASRLGDREALELLNKVADTLTSEQLAAARNLPDSMKDIHPYVFGRMHPE